MELDEYINLEARVSGRMVLLDISATGEENVIEFTDSGKLKKAAFNRQVELNTQIKKLEKEFAEMVVKL